YADIVKISETELELLTGTSDLEKGSALLFNQGISAVLITLGPGGCYFRYYGGTGRVSAYDVKVVDTTGAGDAFLGGLLYWLSGMSLQEICRLEMAQFRSIVEFANATGALATTKKGAIPAMPTLEQVNRCLKTVPPPSPNRQIR
ncbi:MAG: carbohydrate kinase family protein, partial [Bacteroidota bacterium]